MSLVDVVWIEWIDFWSFCMCDLSSGLRRWHAQSECHESEEKTEVGTPGDIV